MPNRIIHEKACNSLTLDALSDGAERLFWRLTTKADDYGRFDADPRSLLGSCFPLKIGRLAPSRIEKWRDELSEKGVIGLYRIGDRVFGAFSNWAEYQRARDSKPKFPDPAQGEAFAASSGELPRVAAYARAGVSRTRDVNENENERREAGGVSTPPTAANNGTQPGFRINDLILSALNRSPKLGAVKRLRLPVFWQAEVRANPGVAIPGEILKAEAYLVAHPERHYKRLDVFLHSWLGRADRQPEES